MTNSKNTRADTPAHDLTACMEACAACHHTCEKMIYQHCLKLGGSHSEPAHLGLMADCVQICRTSADFMLRGSPRHVLTCGICAEICELCADDCDRIGEMQECAEACWRCATMCRKMSDQAR